MTALLIIILFLFLALFLGVRAHAHQLKAFYYPQVQKNGILS
ncbi:hypothetical protein PDQ79_33100 [Bacillus cereus]|nr:hypothetical protein [Bacillus cereus]